MDSDLDTRPSLELWSLATVRLLKDHGGLSWNGGAGAHSSLTTRPCTSQSVWHGAGVLEDMWKEPGQFWDRRRSPDYRGVSRDWTQPYLETNLKIRRVERYYFTLSSRAFSLPVGVSSPQKPCCPPLTHSLSFFLPDSVTPFLFPLFTVPLYFFPVFPPIFFFSLSFSNWP